jgi:hypothetical protein
VDEDFCGRLDKIDPLYIFQENEISDLKKKIIVVLLCSNWSLKKLFSRVGQRKKSRVAEPRVIFGVPTSEKKF